MSTHKLACITLQISSRCHSIFPRMGFTLASQLLNYDNSFVWVANTIRLGIIICMIITATIDIIKQKLLISEIG